MMLELHDSYNKLAIFYTLLNCTHMSQPQNHRVYLLHERFVHINTAVILFYQIEHTKQMYNHRPMTIAVQLECTISINKHYAIAYINVHILKIFLKYINIRKYGYYVYV